MSSPGSAKEPSAAVSEESSEPPKARSFHEIAKNDFVLFGAFMLYVGLISAEAYYRSFGLRFQFLAYPWNLIIFKGLLAILRSPSLWSVIILLYALVQIDHALCSNVGLRFHKIRIAVFYVLLICALWFTTVLGVALGEREALADSQYSSSTLPHIEKIVRVDGSEERCSQCVLLMMNSSEVVYLELSGGSPDAVPRTKILSRSAVRMVETVR